MPKFTKRTVDAAQPEPARDVLLWDDDVSGFGLRIKLSGAKSFIVQYWNRNGRSRRLTIGRFGVLVPEQARQQSRHILADVLKGEDPAEARPADRSALTVAELCREYLDKAALGLIITRRRKPKKASTLYTDRGRVERHVIPLLGLRTVKDLTTADLRAFMRDVIAGKTKADVKTKKRGRAIVEGGPGTASRTMGLLGGILSHAFEEGLRADKPANGIVRPADNRRKARLDAAGYRTLGECLERAEAGGETWQALSTIRIIALTGCRRGEVAVLRPRPFRRGPQPQREASARRAERLHRQQLRGRRSGRLPRPRGRQALARQVGTRRGGKRHPQQDVRTSASVQRRGLGRKAPDRRRVRLQRRAR
jgi:hypothetical protein